MSFGHNPNAVALLPGERIVWVGHPDPVTYARRTAAVVAAASAVLMPLLILGKLSATGVGLPPTTWLIFAALGLLIAIPVYADAKATAPKIRYAITDRRVLLDRPGAKTKSGNPTLTTVQYLMSSVRPSLRLGANGIGTIHLGFGFDRFWDIQ